MKTFVFAIAFAHFVANQSNEKDVIAKEISSIWINNGTVLKTKSAGKKRMWIDGKSIDSCGLAIQVHLITTDGFIGMSDEPKGNKQMYFIGNGGRISALQKILDAECYESNNQLFSVAHVKAEVLNQVIVHRGIAFQFFDNTTKTFTGLFTGLKDLDELADAEITDIFQTESGSLVVSVAECYSGCRNAKYYVIERGDNKPVLAGFTIREPSNENYDAYITDSDATTILIDLAGAKSPSNNGSFIIDTNTFKIITPSLRTRRNLVGREVSKGEIVTHFASTIDDTGNRAIVRYKYSLQLERSLHQIYSDTTLLHEDLSACTPHQLDILRNMVFARHNYKFKSEFYQAYFNYYDFYYEKEMRETRLENVDALLTETDKQNLKLIEAVQKIKTPKK